MRSSLSTAARVGAVIVGAVILVLLFSASGLLGIIVGTVNGYREAFLLSQVQIGEPRTSIEAKITNVGFRFGRVRSHTRTNRSGRPNRSSRGNSIRLVVYIFRWGGFCFEGQDVLEFRFDDSDRYAAVRKQLYSTYC